MKEARAMKAGELRREDAKLSKGGMPVVIADEFDVQRAMAVKMIDALADLATEHVQSVGKFVFLGFCVSVMCHKPTAEAAEKGVFGRTQLAKARPARTVIKTFLAAALKIAAV